MITATAGLRDLFRDYAEGRSSLDELNVALTRLGRTVTREDADLFDLWSQGELWLAEHASGAFDEDELRTRLKGLTANTIRIGIERTTGSSGARTFSHRLSGVGRQGAAARG